MTAVIIRVCEDELYYTLAVILMCSVAFGVSFLIAYML
jgi:hypothetical protein